MNNKAATKDTRKGPSKKLQSNPTNLIVRIGTRDYNYDKVRDATLHAPIIDIPVEQLTLFASCMQEDQPAMETNPIDDGLIRVVRTKPDTYEVISGRNQIVSMIYGFKKKANDAAEKPENLNKTLNELGIKIPTVKARLASWKHLNPCIHLGNKLTPEELVNKFTAGAQDAAVKVRLPRAERTVPIAALLQPPVPTPKAPSSGKYGRIFAGAAAA